MTAGIKTPPQTSITAQITAISDLSMAQLWILWDEYFESRPRHHHRTWLETRLAYRIQERAFGGLKGTVRRKLESIGETGKLPDRLRRDADRLLPGSVLTRTYDDVEHRVLVRGMRDFEYEGQRFSSLSAVAEHITGTHCSGPKFFGLKGKSGATS
jgi:hypothetical protein